MTDQKFIERLIFLAERLCEANNEHDYGSDAYNAVLDEIHETGARFNRSRRPRPWIISFVIICAILFVLYLVYCLLSEGFGL